MSLIATDFATVPSTGFDWYLIFLEKAFEDDLHKDIEKHFMTLGRETGKGVLVVRGFDPTVFRDSVCETPAFNNDTWKNRIQFPSLVVMKRPPESPPTPDLVKEDGLQAGAKVIVFP